MTDEETQVVCICNLFKCVCMWYTYFDKDIRSGATLCTLGDAVASFLHTQDDTTQHLNNVTLKELKQHKSNWHFDPVMWRRSDRRVTIWAHTVSKTNLWITFSWYVETSDLL